MSAFLYGLKLQWKLDIRSKSLIITCYVVPLLFFVVMGKIFTTINIEAKNTLIQSMTVLGVSTGALIGLPPSLLETYASNIKKVYKANGVPLYLGLVTMFLSALIHLLIMCGIIYFIAPIMYDATLPSNPLMYFGSLTIFIISSLSIGSVLGLLVKNQARLNMISQVIFQPSIMLSGIMFSASLLPDFLRDVGKIFPATWGYRLILDGFNINNLIPLLIIILSMVILCYIMLKRLEAE